MRKKDSTAHVSSSFDWVEDRYVVNMKNDKGYVKVYRGMNKPNQEELTKLVADLNKFYP